jgi:hypothetical protein
MPQFILEWHLVKYTLNMAEELSQEKTQPDAGLSAERITKGWQRDALGRSRESDVGVPQSLHSFIVISPGP